METILFIVLPVFCLIGLGFITARTGYLGEAAGDGIAAYVLKLAIPLLLTRSIATAEFSQANPLEYFAVYFSSVLVSWALAVFVIMVLFKRGMRASIIGGVASSFSNLVLLGIPLIELAYGRAGLEILFFLISVHLITMMTIATFLMEYAVRVDGVVVTRLNPFIIAKSLAKNLIVNPIIIGIIAGLLWRFSGLGVGGVVGQVLDMLGRTSGPLALFSLGMGLIKYGIKGNVLPAVLLAFLALVVMPCVVYVMGRFVLPLPPLWFKVAVLAAALPTGINAYLFAIYFKIAEGLATNAIVIALLGSIVSLPIWLAVLH